MTYVLRRKGKREYYIVYSQTDLCVLITKLDPFQR
jgi:hypothetical protein